MYLMWAINPKHWVFLVSGQTSNYTWDGFEGSGHSRPGKNPPPAPLFWVGHGTSKSTKEGLRWGAPPKSNKKPLFGNHEGGKGPTGMFVITSGTSLFKFPKPQFLFQRFKLRALAGSCCCGSWAVSLWRSSSAGPPKPWCCWPWTRVRRMGAGGIYIHVPQKWRVAFIITQKSNLAAGLRESSTKEICYDWQVSWMPWLS